MNINEFLPFSTKCENKIGLFCVIDSLHKNFSNAVIQSFGRLSLCIPCWEAHDHNRSNSTCCLVLLLVMVVCIATSVLDSEWYVEKNIDYQIISPSAQCQYITKFNFVQ